MKSVEGPPCDKCLEANNPNWGIEGEHGVQIVLVLESSDYRALRTDYQTELFASRSGRAIIEILGDRIENSMITNSAKCLFKDGHKKPSTKMYENCAENVLQQIERLNPQLVICFGEKAAEAVTGQKFRDVLGKICGRVVVVHHPRVMTVEEKKMLKEILANFPIQSV